MRSFSMVCGLGLLLVAATVAVAGADKVLSISEIMAKAHKPKQLRAQIKDGLDKTDPDWPAIGKKTKEFVKLAAMLEKNDPPIGEKDSWVKFSKEYEKSVKAIDEAVEKKDAPLARGNVKKLGKMCIGCHRVHRE